MSNQEKRREREIEALGWATDHARNRRYADALADLLDRMEEEPVAWAIRYQAIPNAPIRLVFYDGPNAEEETSDVAESMRDTDYSLVDRFPLYRHPNPSADSGKGGEEVGKPCPIKGCARGRNHRGRHSPEAYCDPAPEEPEGEGAELADVVDQIATFIDEGDELSPYSDAPALREAARRLRAGRSREEVEK